MSATQKHVRWLRDELGPWVAQGLLTADQAEAIRRVYPEPGARLPWGTILFSGLGAVVAGLGVILLFAYNWHALGKATKLGIVFFALVASHAAGIWQLRKGGSRPLGEAACLLGSMFFGAGIWLVAQIYHIEEHYPNGFLLWSAGVLALAWLIPSLAHGYLAVVLLSIYVGSETLGFDQPLAWGPWLLLAGVGALAWRERSRWLLAFALAGFTLTLLFTALALGGGLVLRLMLHAGVAFIAVGVLVRRKRPETSPIWTGFGWAVFLFCLYLLTSHSLASELYGHLRAWPEMSWVDRVYGWFLPVAGLAAWAGVAMLGRTPDARGERPWRYEVWLAPLTGFVLLLLPVRGADIQPVLASGLFNLVFLACAAAWMSRGCREGSLRDTLAGSGLLVALVAARFFDLFESLALRGGLFVLTGALLFAEGIFFRRARRQLRAGKEPA